MERQEIVQRFLREAQAAVRLKSEHVARVLDVGRLPETGAPYIVMEYLEGADLDAISSTHGPHRSVDRGRLRSCRRARRSPRRTRSASSIATSSRRTSSSRRRPTARRSLKVLDFGIAKAPEAHRRSHRSTQAVIGTPAYMSPEQMRSSRDVDARSDIWSLGVVLYELVEGARPFRSEIYSELCLKVGMDPPHPMENPDVPEGLRAIVLKCLEKPVEKRYQTVAELALDLMPFASIRSPRVLRSSRPRACSVVARARTTSRRVSIGSRRWGRSRRPRRSRARSHRTRRWPPCSAGRHRCRPAR